MIPKHFAFVRKTKYIESMPKEQKPIHIAVTLLSAYLIISAILDLILFHLIQADIYALIALALVLLIPIILDRIHIKLSAATLIPILLFITVATYTGNRYNAYKTFFWYDIVLHFSSGILISMTASELFFPEGKHNEKLSFILFFSFIFALAAAGAWEITEFFFDIITGNDVQRNLTVEREIFGAPWQNPGIRDTMNDMINGTVGGFIGCIAIYFKRRKKNELQGLYSVL